MFQYGGAIQEGNLTRVIYTMINDTRYDDVIEILVNYGEVSTSRALLSILGHCYYQMQKFVQAANCYEDLCSLLPEDQNYKFYYAQCLYQAGIFAEATKVLKQMKSDNLQDKILQLQSAIQYSSEEYAGAQGTLNQRSPSSAETMNDEGCLLYQAGMYDAALYRYNTSVQTGGFSPLTCYNIALCHYRKKEKSLALDLIAEIIERGIRNHPELGIGAQIDNENSNSRSIGNPTVLALSGLTQALNLKAAIEYQDNNVKAAREALLDLPPRAENELDPITLHNMALTDPNGPGAGLRRLAFLLELGPPACPYETFANILLLCCKHEMYDTAADILAEHADLTYKFLTPYLYELLDALITAQTTTETADKKLATLAGNLSGKLRTLAVKVQEARGTSEQNALRTALKEYENVLDSYLPVVMARAWLSWREDDFIGAEKEFRASAEFCSENPIWRLHAAHVLFMQGDKYKEAAAFYEPIVRQHSDDILSVSAAVLANLCVSYIMTFQNEEAEELMRKVEKAEELKLSQQSLDSQCLHLCIVNLVVGTLYCAKSNYEFGLSRIAHALEGGSSGSRLCADTWLHVKRCILGLLTSMAKQIVVLPYPAIQEVINFIHSCEIYGMFISAGFSLPGELAGADHLTIGMEARKLRVLLLKLTNLEK